MSEIPDVEILHMESPSPLTPLGAKGLAEGNCMSTPVIIANAIADALDVDEVELPATPRRIHAMIEGGKDEVVLHSSEGCISALPPPLWGRVGEGGGSVVSRRCVLTLPRDPHPHPLPQGGGERQAVRLSNHETASLRFVRPDTVDEALALLAEYGDDARILAGGQSLLPMLNLRLIDPAVLIDIAGSPSSTRSRTAATSSRSARR